MRINQPRSLLLFFILLVFHLIGYAQTPEIQWEKTFGGSGDDFEKNVQQTFDGGYIVGGWTYSTDGDVSGNHGNIDYWILKLDSAGNKVWQKCLGGSNTDEGDGNIGGMVIQQTKDSGYIIAANTRSVDGDITFNHGGIDYWIVKLDNSGNITWQKTLGGTSNDIARSVQQTTDGGYIIAGSASSNDGDIKRNNGYDDYWIVKLTDTGDITWQKSYGGSGDDIPFSIKQTNTGGYIVAGFSDSNDGDITNALGDWDYWVINLDSQGNIVWQKSYGGSGEDYATDVIQSIKGGFLVTGYTESNDGDVKTAYGNYDAWIIKVSDVGDIEWQKSLGGSGDDACTSVQQTKDDGYILSQISSPNDVDNGGTGIDSWIVKLSDSTIQWQKYLGGSGEEFASNIQQTKDGGYILGSFSSSNDGDISGNKGGNDYWIVKLYSNAAANTYYRDQDGDGYGDATKSIQASTSPQGYVTDSTDCDDTKLLYKDNDSDGFGAGSPAACGVANNTDCNDNDYAIHPGAVEIADGKDNNCNGLVDESTGVKIKIYNQSRKEPSWKNMVMPFYVGLNNTSVNEVRVDYTTHDNTAAAPGDYIDASGTVVFAPGEKLKRINVTIKGDILSESTETFNVILSNPVNATIKKGIGTGTIIDNDTDRLIANNNSTEPAVAETNMEKSLKLTPNPASGTAYASLTGFSGVITIRVNDLQGKLLQERKIQTASKSVLQLIDISKYANGIYIITVVDENGNKRSAKLVVHQ